MKVAEIGKPEPRHQRKSNSLFSKLTGKELNIQELLKYKNVEP
jgi:hypothetical protein